MMKNNTPIRYVAAGVAAVALAFGAYSIGNSTSNNGTSGTATAAQSGLGGIRSGELPQGQAPQNGGVPPGFGTPATGAAAAKASAAALAKYKGTVERVFKLSDGSYEVHVITSSTEYHVHVSKDFKVTGADQGGPGAGGGSNAARPNTGSQSSTGINS